MRCFACNKNLNDFESTRKDANGDYIDACNKCFKGLGIRSTVRRDLNPDEAAPDDEFVDVEIATLLGEEICFDDD